jgi:hypothetical protein
MPTEHVCKYCAHWKRNTEPDYVFGGGKAFGACRNKKFVYFSGGKQPTDSLLYWDYEDYSAGFSTGKDFSCKHWKPKGNTEATKA